MNQKSKNRLNTIIVMMIISTLFGIASVNALNYQILSTNPAPVNAGEYADITVKVDTIVTGGESRELKDLELYFKETAFIKPVPGQEVKISSIQTGQTLTRTFRVYFSENIPTGEIPLTMIFKTENLFLEQNQMLYVEGGKNNPEIFIGSIKTIPEKLLKDTKSNTIEITLQNLGDKDANLVTATLNSNPDIITESYSFSMQDSMASIKSGDETQFKFVIDIEKTDQLKIPAELNLRYRVKNDFDNSHSIVEKVLPFNITLVETPWFEIVNVEKETLFQAGTSGNNLILTIENTGLEEGKTIRLRLYPDPSDPFDFDMTSIFVSSSVKENETASFKIPFDILDSALVQEYTINAQFESLVGSNRYIQTERITIEVDSPASSGLNIYLYSLVALTLIVAISIGFFYNRKKK